jgi:hypothetical protein
MLQSVYKPGNGMIGGGWKDGVNVNGIRPKTFAENLVT